MVLRRGRMMSMVRRGVVLLAKLLYASACVAVATSEVGQREGIAWALWIAAVAHLIFALEDILGFFLDDPQKSPAKEPATTAPSRN
jgi:hypothetical protein